MKRKTKKKEIVVDWEGEFTFLLRYTERLERINDALMKQNSTLTSLMEKIINGNK